MPRAEDANLTDSLITFLGRYYEENIAELAEHYQREQRSLYIDYSDIVQYDPDVADDVLAQPETMQEHLEEALRLYDLPIDVSLAEAHIRVHNLPETLDVSEVSRHDNIGDLLDVRGQVQKVSRVRPRVTEAAFECQRCGAMTFHSRAIRSKNLTSATAVNAKGRSTSTPDRVSGPTTNMHASSNRQSEPAAATARLLMSISKTISSRPSTPVTVSISLASSRLRNLDPSRHGTSILISQHARSCVRRATTRTSTSQTT